MDVPDFNIPWSTEATMTAEQRAFFEIFIAQWKAGNPISLDGQASYAYCYVQRLVRDLDVSSATEILKFVEVYRDVHISLEVTGRSWASDIFVYLGRYADALEASPPTDPSSQNRYGTEQLLSIKLAAGERLGGRDVLNLHGPKVTKWGRENIDLVTSYCDAAICGLERAEGRNLLRDWTKGTSKNDFGLFLGLRDAGFASGRMPKAPIPEYRFSYNKKIEKFCAELTREAENTAREENGIPRVSEGWVSETELYYAIKKSFPNEEVVQHGRPKWLGRQHLDIFLPSLLVAVEYQGAQHHEAVEFFGGKEALTKRKRLDAKKRRACSRNGVNLIEVNPGYDLTEVIEAIKGHAPSR